MSIILEVMGHIKANQVRDAIISNAKEVNRFYRNILPTNDQLLANDRDSGSTRPELRELFPSRYLQVAKQSIKDLQGMLNDIRNQAKTQN